MLPKKLRAVQQWINWKYFWNENSQKWDKIPCTSSGIKMSGKDPKNWLTYEQALANHQANGELGIGFQFSEMTRVVGADLDACFDADGQLYPWARDIVISLDSYTEYSPSQTGLHVLGEADIDHTGINNGQIELYSKDRFFTFTGWHLPGTPEDLNNVTPMYSALVEKYKSATVAETMDKELRDGPVPEANPIQDDLMLLSKIGQAAGGANARFNGGVTPGDLLSLNVEKLSKAYPHPSKPFDHSQVDAAAMCHLAFWTGKDEKRMETLFSMCPIGKRDKWQKREDYRVTTIKKACQITQKTYRETAPAPTSSPTNESTDTVSGLVCTDKTGLQFLPIERQKEYFKNMVYVTDQNKIMVPNGMLLNKEQFNCIYGCFIFAYDALGDKTTTDAWKVFTTSHAIGFPKVDHTTFRPDRESLSIITDDLGRRSANTYIPANVPRTPGDVTLFLNHLQKLFPNDNDRAIFLAYIAACVQYPGYKFKWAPLVQGVQGNGKSLIGECLIRAIGKRYCHKPEAQDLTNKFNGFLECKLLIIVEEININVKGKYELMEILKPMITADSIEIQPKGMDKRMADVCANFVMFTNYKDALVKTRGDRRHCVMYCPQQYPEDLIRDGLTEEYFDTLWQWLNNGGYAHVAEYLHTYQIPVALDPSKSCQRAPVTSSTQEAIAQSMGAAELAILEAVNQERPGFMGEWISSIAVSKLFKEQGIRKSTKHWGEMMRELGYIRHPALPAGRAKTKNVIDAGRPRLYVKRDSLASQVTVDVDGAYIAAQGLGNPIMTDKVPAGALKHFPGQR